MEMTALIVYSSLLKVEKTSMKKKGGKAECGLR
jgi:hypothetical protein